MKFIKTVEGGYLNAAKIMRLFVAEEAYSNNGTFVVAAKLDGDLYTLREFADDPKSTTHFDPQAEAQGWLDKLIAELNGGT